MSEILELQIRDNAVEAANGLQVLENALTRIRNITSGNFGLTRLRNQINRLHESLTGINDADVQRVNSLAEALERVSSATANLRGNGIGQVMRQASAAVAPQIQPNIGNMPDLSQTTADLQNQMAAIHEAAPALETASSACSALGEAEQAVHNAADAVNQSLDSTVHDLERVQETAERAGHSFGSLRTAFTNFREHLNEGTQGLRTFFHSITRIAGYRLIRTMLKNITSGLKEGITNLYQYSRAINGDFKKSMDSLATTNLKLKNSLGAMLGPAIQAIIPLLQTLANWAIQAANAINQLISVFSGASYWTQAVDYATEWGDAVKSGAEDADKKVKNLLADFDELNIIQQENKDDDSSGSGKVTPDYSKMFKQSEFAPWIKWIQDHLKLIRDLVLAILAGLLAWKIARMFTDDLKKLWGIFLAVAGAVLLVLQTIEALTNGVTWDTFIGQLLGVAALVGGLALLFGKVGAAIGMMIGGATMAVTGFIDQLKNGINWQNLATLVAGVALVVGGLALAFGATAAAVGLLAGGVLLCINPILEWARTGEIANESLTQLTIGILAVGAGIALLTGGWIPLVVAALAAVVVWVVAKWDDIKAWATQTWENVTNWWNSTIQPWIDAAVAWVNTNIVEPVSKFFTQLGDDVMAAINAIVAWWEGFKTSTILPIVSWIDENIIQPIAGFFSALWGSIMGDEENNLGTWWSNLWETTIYPIVAWIDENITKPIAGFFSALWGTIKGDEKNNLGRWWSDLWRTTIQPIVTWIDENITQPIAGFFAALWGTITGDEENNIGTWWDGLWKSTFGPLVTWIDENITQPISGFFTSLWTALTGEEGQGIDVWWSNLWNNIFFPFVSWIDENIIQPIGGFFTGLWGTITGDENNNIGTWWNNLWNNQIAPIVTWIDENITQPIAGFFTALYGSIIGDETNNLGTWWNSLWNDTFLPIVSWIESNITTPIANLFTSAATLVQDAWNGLCTFVVGIINGLIGAINAVIRALNSINITIPGVELPLVGKLWDTFTIGISGIPELGYIEIEQREMGGFVDAGQMFIARENGLTEYVGQIGNHAAVANNDQIVEGIAYGVAEGQAEQNALLRQNNELMRRLLAKRLVAEINPSAALAKTVKRSEEMRMRNEGV